MSTSGKRNDVITDAYEKQYNLPKFSRGTAESSSQSYPADQHFPPYKVYLSNMSHKPDDHELKNFFDPCSIVEYRVWKDRKAGYSKYSGIIEFGNLNDFRVALTRNNSMLCGRNVKVQVSRKGVEKTRCPEACSKKPPMSKKPDENENCKVEQNNPVSQSEKGLNGCDMIDEDWQDKVLTNPRYPDFIKKKLLSPEDLEKVTKNPPFRVYVGNIAYWVDEKKLEKFFKPAIATDIKFLYKKDNPTNSATVEFEFVEDFIVALKKNGKKFETKTMRVEISGRFNKNQIKNPFTTAPSDALSWRRQNVTEDRKVDLSKVPNRSPFKAHLGNLPYKAVEDDLRTFFEPINVSKIDLLIHRDTGSSKGSAMIEFESREDLVEGLHKSGGKIFNRKIDVSVWKEKPLPMFLPSEDAKVNLLKVPENPPFEALVKNLPFHVREVDLEYYFEPCEIIKFEPLYNEDRFTGSVIVEFDIRQDLIEGLKRSGGYMYRRKIHVSILKNSNQHLLIVPNDSPADIDLSKIPKHPPFKAYVSNLPYIACQIDIEKYFEPLQITNHQPFCYDDSQKFKGSVLVEFNSRKDLIDGLKKGGGQMAGRQIKVAVHHSKGVDSQSSKKIINGNLNLDANTKGEVGQRKTKSKQFISTTQHVPYFLRKTGEIPNPNSEDRFSYGPEYDAYKEQIENQKDVRGEEMINAMKASAVLRVTDDKEAQTPVFVDHENKFTVLPVED